MTESRVAENLAWIYNRWSDLHATRIRGTPKPWRQPTLTLEQRGRLDQLARIEKQERGAFTLGESPAPIHLDAYDRNVDLTKTMARLARLIATELGHQAMLVRAALHKYDDPLLLITYVRNHWEECGAETVMEVEKQAARLRAGLARHFSEVDDGQHLATLCPYCDQPELYVRTIGPKDNTTPVIRCESGTCEPDQHHCGTWHRNLPAWPLHEWDWFAKQIEHADQERERKRLEALAAAGRQDPAAEQEHGNVYIVQIGQHVKIGWTQTPRIRMRQLKPDAVLLSKQGTRQDETRLHHLFSEHRRRGREYFDPHPDILRFAERAHAYDTVTAMLP